MKKNFLKILALILSVAFLVSAFSVLALAAEVGDPVAEDTSGDRFDPLKYLIYNRTYDEGWDATNGFSAMNMSKHLATIDYEVADDNSYNYFMRLEAANDSSAATMTFNLEARKMIQMNGMFAIGISIKADDVCDLGEILSLTCYKGAVTTLLRTDGYKLYAFSDDTTEAGYLGSLADGDWFDVDFLVDWRDSSAPKVSVYLDGAYVTERDLSSTTLGVSVVTLGISKVNTDAQAAARNGASICIDDFSIYQSPYLTGVRDVSDMGTGIFVDGSAEKTVEIYENADQKTPTQVLEEALFMKLGVQSALIAGVREAIDAPPVEIDGNVMIPLELVLEYLGYPYFEHSGTEGYYDSYDVNLPTGEMTYITIGRDTASVAGELVELVARPGRDANDNPMICLDDVQTLFPGMDAMYDDMGLAIVYENITGDPEATLITRENNLDTMLQMMKKFVFEISDSSTEAAYNETGEAVYTAVSENTGFTHPYLITDQATFDKLNAAYAGTDATLKAYLDSVLASAEEIYADMAEEEDGEYAGIKEGKAPTNVYNDGLNPSDAIENDPTVKDSDDGYNPVTSALYEIEEATEKLVDLAFAYQVTREAKYADLAYDIMIVVAQWVHWGPGYFVNCANATSNFAIAYDWLYNYVDANKAAITEADGLLTEYYVDYADRAGESLDAVDFLAYTIYKRGVVQGVSSSRGEFCKFPRTSGTGDKYVTRNDSFHAISASGMILGSLAILDGEDYQADTFYLIGNNLRNLADYGLDLYAPDGSYIESVTYWALGTNALMKLIMSLESAANDDFGFADAWGLDSTFYYACYIANGSGEAWNYHEDGVGTLLAVGTPLYVDTQMFNYAGALLGDNKLITIRQNQLAAGREVTMYDLLFYPDGTIEADAELELNYFMEGIDAFVSRSGWEADDMFVGLMGGPNRFTPSTDGSSTEVFGQMDSGNFIYQNLGVKWIVDLGSDSYYTLYYFGNYRHNYYRTSAEGNNTVVMKDINLGQVAAGDGNMYSTYVDADGKGSYAIVDNSSAYGTMAAAATRGLLVLNGGNTVVIQDEVTRSTVAGAGDIVWVANTYEEIVIDQFSNSRTAYLIHTNDDGSKVYLRATLISSDENAQFTVRAADDKIVNGTFAYDDTQLPLGNLQRLVVESKNQNVVNMAVVFEIVESTQSDLEVGYSMTEISNWDILFSSNVGGEVVEEYSSDTSLFRDTINHAAIAYDDYIHFTTKLNDFYGYISHARYILVANYVYDARGEYNPRGYDPAATDTDYFNDYLKYYDEYTAYRAIILSATSEINKLTDVLAGQ